MQVAEVPGQEECHGPAVAVPKHLVAAGDAAQHEVHVVGPVALPDQVLARFDLPSESAYLLELGAVLIAEMGTVQELKNERIGYLGLPLPCPGGAARFNVVCN